MIKLLAEPLQASLVLKYIFKEFVLEYIFKEFVKCYLNFAVLVEFVRFILVRIEGAGGVRCHHRTRSSFGGVGDKQTHIITDILLL